MSIFRRKKQEDFDAIIFEQESLFEDIKKKDENAPKPNVLTVDEITGDSDMQEGTETIKVNPLEELRKKMISRQEKAEPLNNDAFTPFFNIDDSFLDNGEDTNEKEEIAINPIDEDLEEITAEPALTEEDTVTDNEPTLLKKGQTIILSPEISEDFVEAEPIIEPKITEPEVIEFKTATSQATINDVPFEDEAEENSSVEETNESILESCLPFILDGREEEGLPEEKPTYTLESVASILGEEEAEPQKEPEEDEAEAEAFEETIVFKTVDVAKVPDISDIDNNAKVVAEPPINFTGTMSVFINDDLIGNTRDVDISDEIFKKPSNEPSFEEINISEKEESFTPDFEYTGFEDRKKIRVKLLKERRNNFLKFMVSVFCLIISGILLLPSFSDALDSFNITITIFSAIAFLASFVSNIDIIKSLLTLKGKRTSPDTLIALSNVFALVFLIFAIINQADAKAIFGIAAANVLSLTFRSFWKFKKCQYMYSNFIIIASNSDKHGIALIDDAPTTFAMARRAIDGDVLIAAPRKASNIIDFIKNSTIDVEFDGRSKFMFYISLFVSLLVGVAFGLYKESALVGFVSTASFSLLFAPLTSLACYAMPLYHTSKKLNKHGSMISGITGAKKLEQANACVIDCGDLFPSGTIELADMKILSENNLEETIACAFSITKEIGSPLSHVFKKITETNTEVKIPVADSIKYEETLGITGWVGDKRIFIGNRSLMIAHEINIPNSSVDKKILSDGCFPVYLAADGKALALIVLRYIPHQTIAKELDKITALGLTVLINNCDQNISEEMICDYFDLYSDSIKIMSGSGVHMYKTATNDTDNMNSCGVIKKGVVSLCKTLFAANKIPRAASLLQVVHYITVVLGIIIFAYAFFGSDIGYIAGIFLALYQLICYTLGYIAYLFTKP